MRKFPSEISLNNEDVCKSHILKIEASQVVLVVKNLPANAADIRDVGLISGWGRSPGGSDGNPLQYSCLKNSMERGALQATVYGVAKSHTQLKQQSENIHINKTQRNWVEREVGGGIGMGNTCKSMADSCQCMTKTTTIL